MSLINILVAIVIILVIAFAVKKVMNKKNGCGCGCDSCHSACSVKEMKKWIPRILLKRYSFLFEFFV